MYIKNLIQRWTK